MSAVRVAWPSRARIKRTIDAARAADVKVGGFEIDPDGTIRVLAENSSTATPESSYDRWKAKRNKAAA